MFEFSIGNKWTRSFLQAISQLNRLYEPNERVVKELYGSLQSEVLGFNSARPDFRLPRISVNNCRDFIAAAHDAGIKINYTLNAPMHNSLEYINKEKSRLINVVSQLVEWGVDIITVANSLFAEIIHSHFDIALEISSLMHARSVAQLPFYAQTGVRQVCMDVNRNREISFLAAFQNCGEDFKIETKLLVNELCSIGGAPCNGIYQADCVIHSCLGGNPTGLFGGWPFSRCATSRAETAAVLKAGFILPEWLDLYYSNTGIRIYKITGRTCPEEWLINIVRAYLSGNYSGDIRELWIDPGHSYNNPGIGKNSVIRCEDLLNTNFVNKWFDNPNFHCNEHCGFDCFHCDLIAQKLGQF